DYVADRSGAPPGAAAADPATRLVAAGADDAAAERVAAVLRAVTEAEFGGAPRPDLRAAAEEAVREAEAAIVRREGL
ncbi:MAG TPA: hypothetical protein VEI02_00630, partial [Planctomycetota bacterium]|nr:hypothetical protein [Planctomycetota bacterium]